MRRAEMFRREGGFTLLEMVFAGSLAATMLGAGLAITASMSKSGAAQSKKNALASRAEEIVERLARELSVAGMSGEDVNKSGTLDVGEDKNHDGRLDADWSLANGASAEDVTFNVLRSDWTWSGPVRWYVDDSSVLWRSEKGSAIEMARGVASFAVLRSGDEVTVDVTLGGSDLTGDAQAQSAERRVYVRN